MMILAAAFALASELASSRPQAGAPLTVTAETKEIGESLDLVPLVPTPGRSGIVLTLLGSPAPGAVQLEIQNTGTGYAETFYLQFPESPSRVDRSPVLVAFHQFGSLGTDVLNKTSFEQGCWDRNWFLVVPLGASSKSFSSLPSQANTELVIELVLRMRGLVDPNRIYGVGFSMGGLNAMNYAARHLDPTRPMFAAIVNHTGTTALAYAYEAGPGIQPILKFWFGGAPEDFPFEYQRSSLLDAYLESGTIPGGTLNMMTGLPGGGFPGGGGGGFPGGGGGVPTGPPVPPPALTVNEDTSLALNLTHVPLYCVRGDFDPVEDLRLQWDALVAFMAPRNPALRVETVSGISVHEWQTLDGDAALEWLSHRRLRLPTEAKTLVDRDDRYFHFFVEQEQAGRFSPIDWKLDRQANAAHVQTENVDRLVLFVKDAELRPALPISLFLDDVDDTLDEVRLAQVPRKPELVLRNGIVTHEYEYSAGTRTLVLPQSRAAGTDHWRILLARR